MVDVLIDAMLDSLKVLPFLILVYILIEVLEHTTSSKISSKLLKGKLSPLIGAGVGVIPQCGFSVVATKLYTNRAIAMGTLLAVYISTSDEAFAVLISDFSVVDKLWPLLIIKVTYAVIVGYVVNFFVRKRELKAYDEHITAVGCHNHVVGQDDECGHCHHEDGESEEEIKAYRRNAVKRFVIHPLLHALTTFIYIFAVNLILGVIIYYVGEEALSSFMGKIGYLQPLLAAIVGLIPNCAASVVITEMYALGTLSLGGALSGLCVSAGIGVAVLVKENKSVKDTLVVVGLLFGLSVLLGLTVTAITALI
ncbi:MAG: arsenic efflux protein [Clostridiales bacterium]|nr:arsenic efflux protein [Clostridiales bacterium]